MQYVLSLHKQALTVSMRVESTMILYTVSTVNFYMHKDDLYNADMLMM